MYQNKNKALFFDVDGTLVDEKTKNFTAGVLESIRDAQSNGYMAFICTGRTIKICENLGRIFHMDGIICGCGTHIIVHGDTVFEHRIPLERCNELKDKLAENKLDVIMEAQEGLYFNSEPHYYSGEWKKILYSLKEYGGLRYNALGDKTFIFDKFCIQRPDKGTEAEARYLEFIDTLKDFDCIDRNGIFHECVPKGNSKGNGIEFIMKKYNIAPEDAYVFGDSSNDLSMFQANVKNKILMKTHSEVLEPYATYVTDDPLEDGIKNALIHFKVI